MRLIRRDLGFTLAALLIMVASTPLYAAECADVFSRGVNPNLGSGGLDLSGVQWGTNVWPASGSSLSGGDYYFSGSSLGNNYSLSIAPGEQVRIFVNGSLSMGSNVDLNASGEAGQLLIVVRGSLTFGNNADVNGLIYAGGSIGRRSSGGGSAPDIEGAIAAAGAISVSTGDVAYDPELVNSSLLTGLCDRNIELSANGVAVGPVVVEVGETVNFSVDARNCPSANAVWGANEWRDEWTGGPNGGTQGFDSSPCGRVPVTERHSFSQPGLYTVTYSADYCSSSTWGFCTRYTRFGADEIDIEVRDESSGLNCETQDDFNAGPLDPDLWVTSRSNGNFTPSVVQNRLRMTESVANQATAATLQAEIPGDQNLVILRFDYYAYGGSGADGIAVVLSDALITPRPGSYGGSLGYAQRTGASAGDGFAGGWLGVGIDEYGNFAAASEGRNGGRPGGRTPQSVSVRGSGSGRTGYAYLAGTGSLSPAIDSTGQNAYHTYEIMIDSRNSGQALVSVQRDTGSGMQTLIAPFDVLARTSQAAVPENLLLSITGSTGGSTNIHELDNVELCALRINEVGEQVHHFEIEHDGVGLTCQPEEQITIRACASSDCSQRFTDTVVANMAPSGWVGGDNVTINGGETTAALRGTSAGTVNLDVVGSTPSTRPQAVTLCRRGNSGLSAANCQLRFYDTGLVFDVPDMVANEGQTGIQVRAVRTEGSPEQACVPAFENVTRDVNFWSDYINPDSKGVSVTPAVSVNGNAVGGSPASPTAVALAFGRGGVAEIDVNYPDAGRMQLNATYQGSAANSDQGLTMPGADQFVSRPVGFCIEAPSADAACASPLANCSVLTAAGDPFDLRIRAVAHESGGNGNLCSGNATTQNFRAALDLGHSLVAPSPVDDGGVPGALGKDEVTFAQVDDGEVTLAQSVSEVGVFTFSVPSGQPYLSTTLSGSDSADIGRFIPASFQVTSGAVDPGQLEAECVIAGGGDFQYIGQPMGWALPPSVPIVALNRQGTVTENYTRGDFRKLSAADVQRQFPTVDSSQTTADGSASLPLESEEQAASLNWDNTNSPGVMNFLFSTGDLFWYPKTQQSRVTPFAPALELALTSIEDSDGVQAASMPYTFTAGLAMDSDTGNSFEVRYGRLAMENVYGPENLDELPMPVRLESWTSTGWQSHDGGNCLPTDLAAVRDAGPTTSDHHSLDVSALQMGAVNGDYFLRLEPDGSQGTDTLHWPLSSGVGAGQPPQAHDWLMEFWGRDPNPGALQNPEALATFGVYRGNDRIIYWREVEN